MTLVSERTKLHSRLYSQLSPRCSVDRSPRVACRPGSRMVDGAIVSRFIRLPLKSFALRSAVQLQSESASRLSSGFSAISRGVERFFPWFSDTLHASKTIVRPFPRSDRIESISTYSRVERCARNRYVSRCGAMHGYACISFCGYRRGNSAFFRTRVVESAGSRGNGVCVHTFVEA